MEVSPTLNIEVETDTVGVLHAEGVIRVILTRNARVERQSETAFRRLRGTPEFAKNIRNLVKEI
jgi:hypothetical protein